MTASKSPRRDRPFRPPQLYGGADECAVRSKSAMPMNRVQLTPCIMVFNSLMSESVDG